MIHFLKEKEVIDDHMRSKSDKKKFQATSCVALMRLRKDMEELSYQHQRFCARGTVVSIHIPHGSGNQATFTCTLTPAEGPFAHGTFVFDLRVPHTYPYYPPTVRCLTKVFHPNFDFRTGAVYLPILTDSWRPVLTMNTVIFSLQLLFLEPARRKVGSEAILNPWANQLRQESPSKYEELVRATMGGGKFFGVTWASTFRNGPLGNESSKVRSVKKRCFSVMQGNPTKKRRLNITISDLRNISLSDNSSCQSSPEQAEVITRKRPLGDDFYQHTELKKRGRYGLLDEPTKSNDFLSTINRLRAHGGNEKYCEQLVREKTMMMDEDS